MITFPASVGHDGMGKWQVRLQMQLQKVNAFIALIEYLMNRVACVLVCVCVRVSAGKMLLPTRRPGKTAPGLTRPGRDGKGDVILMAEDTPGSMKIVLSANCAVINYVCVCVKSVI